MFIRKLKEDIMYEEELSKISKKKITDNKAKRKNTK